MKLIDHYPETLRDIYDKIQETIEEAGGTVVAGALAWKVTEWIRANWSRRCLIPSWWGPVQPRQDADQDTEQLPGVQAQVDPLCTMRGRELRDVVVGILLTGEPTPQPCHLAVAIAARVEQEWSTGKVYVPQAAGVDRALRDASIWTDFAGGLASVERIIEKYDLSQDRIYVVFRRLQKDKESREQPLLPGL